MLSEFRSAARGLARWRGGAVAMVTLSIAIATASGLWALVRVVLEDLPGIPDLHRVARIYAASPALGVDRSQIALSEFDGALSKAGSFRAAGAYAAVDATLGADAAVRPIVAGYASPGFFGALAVPPATGRAFTPDDLAGRPVAILSDGLWRREFPDGRTAGTTVVVDGVERAVVGVMPSEFHYGFVGVDADVWIPMTRASRDMPAIVSVFARLRDGVEWPAAQAELAALSPARASSRDGRGQWTWRAIPLVDDTRYRATAAYAATLGPALLILLIACVNVACMLMARGVEREKELTVRAALGATRGRVFRLLLLESLLLALVSGAIGGALAVALLRVLASLITAVRPSLGSTLRVDVWLLPMALAATALACVLFGTVPALRLSKRDVAASLNGVPPNYRMQIAGYGARDVIVFTEIACAVGFVVWTAMLYTLFAQLNLVKATFPADRVVALRVPGPAAAAVAARIETVPGVAAATLSSGMLGGGYRERIEAGGARMMVIARVPVGTGFFDAIGVPIIRGRGFDPGEVKRGADVAVLAESAARSLAPDGNAVGRRLKMTGRPDVIVVGVCRNAIDYGSLSQADAVVPEMYVPYDPSVSSSEAVVLARTWADGHGVLRAVAVAAQPLAGVKPVRPVVVGDEFRDRNPAASLVAVKVLASFAILTLLLAGSGVFAVISQSVAQRTREFGIHLAIGATSSRVLRMVLAREAKLIAAAVATGVVFTMLATRALFAELVRLSAILPSMWVGALLLAGGVAAAAVVFATYRIVRLEPAAVLRRS
jgi:predicted permease